MVITQSSPGRVVRLRDGCSGFGRVVCYQTVVIIPALSVDGAIVVAAPVALSAVVVASVALSAVVVTIGAAVAGLGRRICANSWVSTNRNAV